MVANSVCTFITNVFVVYIFSARIVSEFTPPPEVKLKPSVLQHNDRAKQNVKDAGRGRGLNRDATELNVDESQFVRMKSVFSEGPMMAQARVNNSHLHYGKFWNIYLFLWCYIFIVRYSV